MAEPAGSEIDGTGTGAGPVGRRRRWEWIDVGAALAVGVLAVVFRFVTRSPLWLDEALSVNIARLGLTDIPEALRHDGHPPLYYFLLHGWMAVFGHGDVAVRALSGVFGLLLLPLAWVAGGRLGGRRGALGAVLVVALSPYAIRYSTETRMYSMVMVLALAAWLVADDALESPTWPRLGLLSLLTGALLWSHYWAMWLLGAAVLGLAGHVWHARRVDDSEAVANSTKVLGALALGALSFLPWVPSLLYQSSHTGTPWAGPVRPTEMLATAFVDLGGGPQGEAVLLSFVLVVLLVLALFGRGTDARHVELDMHTRPEARPMLITVAVTMAIASVVALATGSAFATRYLAVVVPLALVAAGLGLARLRGGVAFRVLAAALLLLGAAGGVRNVLTSRTQAREVARAVVAGDPTGSDLVVTCPDQLGPALARELPEGTEVVTYPDLAPPELVDWADYSERLDRADPALFATTVLNRAGDRTIWLAWSGTYRTHEGTCEEVLNAILAARPWATNPVVDGGEDFFEHEALWRFPAEDGG